MLEADLEWIVSWTKGDFIGREALAAQKAAGVLTPSMSFCRFFEPDRPERSGRGREPARKGIRSRPLPSPLSSRAGGIQ